MEINRNKQDKIGSVNRKIKNQKKKKTNFFLNKLHENQNRRKKKVENNKSIRIFENELKTKMSAIIYGQMLLSPVSTERFLCLTKSKNLNKAASKIRRKKG